MKNPQLHHADAIHLYPDGYDSLDNPCVARPMSYDSDNGFKNRLKLAWMVFTGKADVIVFKAFETEGEFKKTARYRTWKKLKGIK